MTDANEKYNEVSGLYRQTLSIEFFLQIKNIRFKDREGEFQGHMQEL